MMDPTLFLDARPKAQNDAAHTKMKRTNTGPDSSFITVNSGHHILINILSSKRTMVWFLIIH